MLAPPLTITPSDQATLDQVMRSSVWRADELAISRATTMPTVHLVTVRQRPGTAAGVVFIALEDEAGAVNVICWPSLVDKFRREVMGAQLLGVFGVWQCESKVRHLVAKRLVDLSHMLGELDTRSRDFH